MRLLMILLCAMLCSSIALHAQKQNNNWCFGWNGGVTFNTNPPSAFFSAVHTYEGVATVSHRVTGDLLFYAHTTTLYNRNHAIMKRGDGIGGDAALTSAQGICIVPFIADTNKYYVFAISGWYETGRLEYSVVDMSLDGGLGAVVAGKKNIVIDSVFTEAITVVPICRSYWLLVKKRISGNIYAYKITKDGVDMNPVITTIPYAYTNKHVETMKVSPDRKRLVIGSWNGKPSSFLAVHDFNIATGQAPNGMVVDVGGGGFYGIEFSPNSQVLYAAGWTGHEMYQYDLSQTTAAAIKASRKTIHTVSDDIGMFQLGPDSNIYVSVNKQNGLDRIANPNALYPGCIYTVNAIPLATAAQTTMGLPPIVAYPVGYDPFYITKTDTLICFKEPIVLRGRSGQAAYEWQDGSLADTLSVGKKGTYWVRSPDICDYVTDTIVVEETTLKVDITDEDTTICNGDTVMLHAQVSPANAAVAWSTGDAQLNTRVAKEGKYIFRAYYTGCEAFDEIDIKHHIRIRLELGDDKEICSDKTVVLPTLLTSGGMDSFLWQDGSTNRKYIVNKTGTYYVRVSNVCESVSDTVTITTQNCYVFFPSAFSPNGDGHNDRAHLIGDIANVGDYHIRIYNRWGQEVFFSTDVHQGWDGYFNGQPAAMGAYYYYIKYTYRGKEELKKGSVTLVR